MCVCSSQALDLSSKKHIWMLSRRPGTGERTTNKMFFPPNFIMSLYGIKNHVYIKEHFGEKYHHSNITAVSILIYILLGYIKHVCVCNNTEYKKILSCFF